MKLIIMESTLRLMETLGYTSIPFEMTGEFTTKETKATENKFGYILFQ